MPHDKQKMLDVVDEFLSLEEDEQVHYLVGRRFGRYRGVSDMRVSGLREEVNGIRLMVESRAARQGLTVEDVLNKMRENMI